uniref:Uncharacterized protein n=1 Tax=Amphimedon queenslandica TaxID=400682 RepID=A0A1X7UU74_AMPQE
PGCSMALRAYISFAKNFLILLSASLIDGEPVVVGVSAFVLGFTFTYCSEC